jgi:pyruvate-formate lyase-activating enzyme
MVLGDLVMRREQAMRVVRLVIAGCAMSCSGCQTLQLLQIDGLGLNLVEIHFDRHYRTIEVRNATENPFAGDDVPDDDSGTDGDCNPFDGAGGR